jgi:polyhydroxyalkanoate synthase
LSLTHKWQRLRCSSGKAPVTIAVVNTADEVAPSASIKPFTDAMLVENVRIIEYPGEVGVSLQHLGILLGRQAHAEVWPKIISWLNTCR